MSDVTKRYLYCGEMTESTEEDDADYYGDLYVLAEDYDRDIKNLLDQIDQRNTCCGDALDKLWKDVMPKNYGDWEYPGQAYRHLAAEFLDLQTKLELAEGSK